MNEDEQIEVTAALARFAATLELSQIPQAVVDRVKLLLLDALASALTGWTSDVSSSVARTAHRLFGEGKCTVLGSTELSAGAATLVNGYLITARSFCDVHQPTLCHVSPVSVPPVLTSAELVRADGASLLTSLAVAMESTVRIGIGLDYPTFRARGWHTPGVVGPIGGALGAGRVLGFTPQMAEQAAGIGASQGAGTFASFGTPTIKHHQARAAWSALLSAWSVYEGVEGPAGILTADDGGVLSTYSDGGKPDAVTSELGHRWEIEGITTRLWPTAAALQSVVAMVLLDAEAIPVPSDIESVTVLLSPASYEMNAGMGWDTPFRAVLSARYVTATVLQDRRCWLDQFTPERLGDPPPLIDSVSVELDTTLAEGGAGLIIRSGSGKEMRLRRTSPKGSPTDPANWEEVVDKFERAAADRLEGHQSAEAVAMVDQLERIPDTRELTSVLGSGRWPGRLG